VEPSTGRCEDEWGQCRRADEYESRVLDLFVTIPERRREWPGEGETVVDVDCFKDETSQPEKLFGVFDWWCCEGFFGVA